jgi:hypothetical protein
MAVFLPADSQCAIGLGDRADKSRSEAHEPDPGSRLIISELSARGLMPQVGWLRSECRSRKDNLLLANLLGQTHAFNIDPNLP